VQPAVCELVDGYLPGSLRWMTYAKREQQQCRPLAPNAAAERYIDLEAAGQAGAVRAFGLASLQLVLRDSVSLERAAGPICHRACPARRWIAPLDVCGPDAWWEHHPVALLPYVHRLPLAV
jgi:hypothetical protein